MLIIEIAALDNGAHRNQSWNNPASVPDGFALYRGEASELENFPFGGITVEEINGVPTVISWWPGTMPEPEEPTEPTAEPTVWDELDAAYQEGVDSI